MPFSSFLYYLVTIPTPLPSFPQLSQTPHLFQTWFRVPHRTRAICRVCANADLHHLPYTLHSFLLKLFFLILEHVFFLCWSWFELAVTSRYSQTNLRVVFYQFSNSIHPSINSSKNHNPLTRTNNQTIININTHNRAHSSISLSTHNKSYRQHFATLGIQ